MAVESTREGSEAWRSRRLRATLLQERYPFAAELLRLYGALLDVQELAFEAAQVEGISPAGAARFAAEAVLPRVVQVTAMNGPALLGAQIQERLATADPVALVEEWLTGVEQTPVDRYLARASTAPILEALGTAAGEACVGPRDERHCPRCGGLPQVSVLEPPADSLVGARRRLLCSRCGWLWTYPRLTCASCGERQTSHLHVFAEEGTTEGEMSGSIIRGLDGVRPPAGPRVTPWFPHVRVEACRTCHRYVLGVDLTRDSRAVPIVDELAALPLDLYAQEQGFIKIVPNLLGV